MLWFVVGGIATAVGLGVAASIWDDQPSGSTLELPPVGDSTDSPDETEVAEEDALEG